MSIHLYSRGRVYLSWKVWFIYAALFAVGIPWYWPRGHSTIWWGMPAWVVVALASSVALSVYTACLLSRPWPEESQPRGAEDSP